MISLERLIFLIDETYVTSLKVKTIASPFDFLAPGKSSGVNNPIVFPTKSSNKSFTLVLDLDETLIHFAYVRYNFIMISLLQEEALLLDLIALNFLSLYQSITKLLFLQQQLKSTLTE